MQETAYNMNSPCDRGVSAFPATMILPPRKETYDSYTPSVSSSASMNGVLHRKSSMETIQSQEGSISNFSFHSATAAIDNKDLSGQGHLSNYSSNSYSGQDPYRKSFHSFEKPTFRFRNQSLSTVCTIREPESDRNSTATSTSRQRFRSLSDSSLEDDAESSPPTTPRSSRAITPTLTTGPNSSPSHVHADPPSLPSGDGDSRPLATVEVSTAVTPSIQEYQEPLSNVNIRASATANYKDPYIPSRQAVLLPSSRNAPEPSRSRDHKSYDSFSRSASSRRASKITVEYHKPSRQSIQEYQQLLSDVNLHAAASYKDPFVPSRQAPPPPSSPSSSKPSRSRDRLSPVSVSHHKSRNPHHKPPPRSRGYPVFTPPTTIHEAESEPSSTAPSMAQQEFSSFTLPPTKEMATSSVPPTPPRPSRANTVNLADLYADPNPNPVHSNTPTTLLDGLPGEAYDSQSYITAGSSTAFVPSVAAAPLSTPPHDRMGTVSRSRSVTAKGKIGMLGFMTDFLNSNKRPKISSPDDPVLQDSGVSKSEQEKSLLAVMDIVNFYQEGGGDVWDKMGHAAGSSQSSPIPGTLQAAFPRPSKPVDDNFVPTVSVLPRSSQTFSDISKRPVVSTPKMAVPTSHPPASYRPAPFPPQPAQPNLDRSNSQRSAPKQPRSDTLVRASKDRNSPGPPAPADLAIRSQATVAVNGPVEAGRRAPQPPKAPEQQSGAVASLAKTTGAIPRQREKKKEDKTNDADIVKRLQQICTDADPMRLYRDLVMIRQG